MPHSRRTFTKVAATTAFGELLFSRGIIPATAQDAEGATLRFAMNAADVETLDPHYASGGQDRAIVDMVFNGLVRFTPGDSNEFEPDLATDMPTAADNDDGTQTWSFTLKSGVMTHPTDGVESA